MATTNPVYNVLATAGNQAILPAGSRPGALANGQLGIFNYHTGLSIDGTALANAKDIYLAVGINRTTGGVALAEDIERSAGDMLQVRNARAITVKGTVSQIEKVQLITGYTAKCNTEYILRIDVVSPLLYQLNGYNQNVKAYSYHTGCCTDPACETCGDPVELAVGLVNAINSDPEGVFVASLFGNKLVATIGDPTGDGTATITIGNSVYSVALLTADTAIQAAAKVAAAINASTSGGYNATSASTVVTAYPKASTATSTTLIVLTNAGATGVTVTAAANTSTPVLVGDAPAFAGTYPDAGLGIQVTTVAKARPIFGDINAKYYRSGTDFNVYLGDGFACNGVVTTTVPFQAKEGSGYDLKQLEYVAEGWGVGGPYRTNSITGLGKPFESFLNTGANYNLVSLAYDQESVGGWLEYKNNLETMIAIPCADSTTLTGLATILDLIFTQFGAMANDVAAMDCTNTNITTINDYALDGIESLG